MIKRIFWLFFEFLYKFVAKPLIFLSHPDKSHENTIKIFSKFGRWRPALWLVRLFFKPGYKTKLNQELWGLSFSNPVGLAAGFDKNAELLGVASNLGFGFGEVGSVTYRKCRGNSKPWFYRLKKTKSLVVNVGLANLGVRSVLKNLKSSNVYKNYPVILSVAKTNSPKVVSVKEGIDDYVGSIKMAMNNSLVAAIEINISCPNAYGGEPFTDPKKLERLLKAVEKLDVKKPLLLKLPSDLSWQRNRQLVRLAVDHGSAGVTIANLAKDRQKIDLKDDLPASVKGNLSGAPVADLSNQLIAKTYKEFGDKIKIIGLGGVFSAEDAYKKIRLGASLVELITGMIYEGPQLPSQINRGLVGLMWRDGFDDISQVVGVDIK